MRNRSLTVVARHKHSLWRPLLKTAALPAALIAGGYSMALAVGSSSLPWLAWVSLLPLFLAIRVQLPTIALLSGALWGASLSLSSTLAVTTSVHPTWPSFLLLITAPALYASLGSRYTRWSAGFDPLALGLGWIGVELALLPLGLRNGLLAGTFGGELIFDLIGQLLGYVFISMLVTFIIASFVAVFSNVLQSADTRESPQVMSGAGELFPSQSASFIQKLFLSQAHPRAPPVGKVPVRFCSPSGIHQFRLAVG